jgi:hypothetical protein
MDISHPYSCYTATRNWFAKHFFKTVSTSPKDEFHQHNHNPAKRTLITTVSEIRLWHPFISSWIEEKIILIFLFMKIFYLLDAVENWQFSCFSILVLTIGKLQKNSELRSQGKRPFNGLVLFNASRGWRGIRLEVPFSRGNQVEKKKQNHTIESTSEGLFSFRYASPRVRSATKRSKKTNRWKERMREIEWC